MDLKDLPKPSPGCPNCGANDYCMDGLGYAGCEQCNRQWDLATRTLLPPFDPFPKEKPATIREFSALEGMRLNPSTSVVKFSKAEFKALHAVLALCQDIETTLPRSELGNYADAHIAALALEGLIQRNSPKVVILREYPPR